MTQDTYNLLAAVMVSTILGLLFWAALRVSKDKHGRIRTASAAWWLIVLFCPWGVIWAICRSDGSAADRERNLREITGANDR
jgi:hypothetical protein